jgi:hypothetical protein
MATRLAYSYPDPEDFYDFSKGVPISDPEVRVWISRAVGEVKTKLNKGVKEAFATMSSGNTLVLCEGYLESAGKYTIMVSVATTYKRATETSVEL